MEGTYADSGPIKQVFLAGPWQMDTDWSVDVGSVTVMLESDGLTMHPLENRGEDVARRVWQLCGCQDALWGIRAAGSGRL